MKYLVRTGLTCLSFVLASVAYAAEVNDVIKEGTKRTDKSAVSQTKVGKIVDETEKMFREYVQLLKRNETLRTYIGLKEKEIEQQRIRINEIKEQINRISQVARETAPLMHRMADELSNFINNDIPFLIEERTERIVELRNILNHPAVSESEKFRKVLEAYQIELEFGNTIETFQDNFQAVESDPVETVNYLRIGRIAFIAQSLDQSENYMWDTRQGQWQEVSEAVYAKALKEGINIASKRSAPDLLSVPLTVSVEDK